jgi:hypothetical protein
MKITERQLTDIFAIAKQRYIDNAQGRISGQAFMAKCYVDAIDTVLHLNLDLQFPEDLDMMSIEDRSN